MPDFTQHPFIKSIADISKWTVSDRNKRPIDMWGIICEGQIYGALAPDEHHLCTLEILNETIPITNRTNSTFYVCAVESGFVMLDIEPDCPQKLKDKFLQMPYVYGEVSMSGKGLHLAFPLPDNYMDYPIAFTKPALKNENKWFEILLNHYCVFTGKTIAPATGNEDFNTLFYEMASKAKETVRTNFDLSEERPKNIPESIMNAVVRQLINKGQSYKKTKDDFGGDDSKYEFSTLCFMYRTLKRMTKGNNQQRVIEYSDSDKAWLLYEAAKEVIPYRPKHDEERDGLPWLLYEARECIAKFPKDDKENEKKNDQTDNT